MQISERLINIFRKGKDGNKPFIGSIEMYNRDKDFKDYYHLYEYFHGDNGKGLGAAHQTGWAGLVADLIQEVNVGK